MSRINRTVVYLPTAALLIIQNFIPSELFWIIGAAVCLFYIFSRGWKIFMPFSEYAVLLLFLLWGALSGALSLFMGNNTTVDYVRDVFYFCNPIIFMYMGASIAERGVSIYALMNSFILAGGILSAAELIALINNMNILNDSLTVNSWRGITGGGLVVMGISLAVVLSGAVPKENRLPRILLFISTGLNLCYLMLTLSRTNMLVFAVTYLVLLFANPERKKISIRLVSALSLLISATVLLYLFLPEKITEEFGKKLFSSVEEMSTSHDWSDDDTVQNNWRGYENYQAAKQWEESDVVTQIFGHGFGKRIYVGKYAYTLLEQTTSSGEPADSIAVLHNGYATLLIKLGALGLIFYIGFYLLLIVKALYSMRASVSIYSRSLLSMSLILLMLTYFLNGLYKDYCFLPILLLLSFSAYKIQRREDYNLSVLRENISGKNDSKGRVNEE